MSLVFFANLLYTGEHGNEYFLGLTAIGLVYNLALIFTTKVYVGDYRFLSAGFIGALTSFILFNGGIIQLMYLKNFDYIEANAFGLYLDYPTLIKFTTITAVGNAFYWFGFLVPTGDKLFAFYYKGLGYERLLKLNIGITFPKVLIVTGIFLNFVLFSNGAFGRGLAEPESFTGFMRVLVQFSSYVEKISLIGYFLLALNHFKTGKHKTWFWVTLLLQAVFALVSGARGPLIYLFILTILPYYYVHRKITKQIALAGVFTLVVAFTVASEIKAFTRNMNVSEVSLSNYTDSYLQFREQSSDHLNRIIYTSVYYSLMRRFSSVAQGSVAVRYKDEHGVDPTDPKFVGELINAPLYVVIPRSKLGSQFPSWGQWFRLKVLKQNNDTYLNNISFGPVAYFYLAGKWIFVAFGYFFYGLTLRFGNNFLRLNTGISFLLYLAILASIGNITASIPSAYVSFFRYVLFLPLLFYAVIKFMNKLRI